jgi:hypothetical protein
MSVVQQLHLWCLEAPAIFLFVLFSPDDADVDTVGDDGYPVEAWWLGSRPEGVDHGDPEQHPAADHYARHPGRPDHLAVDRRLSVAASVG